MEIIISFFRDFLSGPLYIAIVVINSILICAGIGYFAEKSQNAKKEKQKFKDTHVAIENDAKTNSNPIPDNINSPGFSSPIVSGIFNQMANQQVNSQQSQPVNQPMSQQPVQPVNNQNINMPIQNNNQNVNNQ